MRAWIKKINGLLVSGVLLAIPLSAIVYALQAIHKQMKQFAKIAEPYLAVDSFAGFTLASIIGWLLVIGSLLILGLLSKTPLFSSLARLVEENILSFVPGYRENVERLRTKFDKKLEEERKSSTP